LSIIPYAVIRITGTSGYSLRARASSAWPSIGFICTSLMSRPTGSRASATSALSPSMTSITV